LGRVSIIIVYAEKALRWERCISKRGIFENLPSGKKEKVEYS